MSEQAAVADSTPAIESTPVGQPIKVQIPDRWKDMDVSRGPLVDITPEQRAEFRKTGNLPEPPKKEEAAPSSDAKTEVKAEPVGESETPEKTQELPKPKPKQTAEERIAQLEATIEKIRKGKGIETKAESSPAPKPQPVQQQPPTRPKPTAEDKKEDGTPKFETYEDFVEDLADWKSEQREVKNQREQAQQAQAKEFNSKVAEARTRYENFDEVVQPTATAINSDAGISPVIKQLLSESDVLPDILFTLGSDQAELAKFVTMARENPGKAIRYVALTESLIAEELKGNKTPVTEEAPAKPRTQAPRPPSEVGGRAATPPDALEAAAKSNDFRSFSAEATRRQLAKLKG